MDFIAQKKGGLEPESYLFPTEITAPRYNIFKNGIVPLLKPFANGLYGMVGNVIFVASQNIDIPAKTIQGFRWYDTTITTANHRSRTDIKKNSGWQMSFRQDIYDFIMDAVNSSKIIVRKWRAPRKEKSVEQTAEFSKYRSMQSNAGGTYSYHKTKGIGHIKLDARMIAAPEYLDHSQKIYGQRMSETMSKYMDGSGMDGIYFNDPKTGARCSRPTNWNSYRPLDPQFPVKSGK